MTCEMLRKKSGVQIALNDLLKQVRERKDLVSRGRDDGGILTVVRMVIN